MVTLTPQAKIIKVHRMTKCLKATLKQERGWLKEELKDILLDQGTVEFMVQTLDLSSSKCKTAMALAHKIRVRYQQRRAETTPLEIQGCKDKFSHQTRALTRELQTSKILALSNFRTSLSCKVKCATTWAWSSPTRTKPT